MVAHRLVAFGIGFACLPWLASAADAATPNAGQRPNIVFAFADDWGRYASCYAEREPGGPADCVATPHFDRIAREGVLFTNAFVNAPSCTPCRSSLLSGQYFWRTGRGAILQGAIWDDAIPTYPLLLEQAGYHIGYTYKVWTPGKPAHAPYGGKANAYEGAGRRFNGFSQFAMRQSDSAAAKQTLLDEVRGNFRQFLEAGQDEPFCYWFGPTNCHRKWVEGSAQELWNIDPDELQGKLPAYLPDVPTVRQDFADYLGEVQAFDASLGVLLDELEQRGELDNTLIVVSGDHGIPGVPRGKCNLYDLGTHVPLAVRWPASVPGGRVVSDFVNLPDLAATFLEAGGVARPDVMTAKSLLPILQRDQAGRIDLARDHVITGRERHVAKARVDMLPYPQRAFRTDRFLYIRNFQPDRWPMGTAPGMGRPPGPMPSYKDLAQNTLSAFPDLDASPTKAWIVTRREEVPAAAKAFQIGFMLRPGEELYDVTTDPDCLRNLAEEAGYQATKQALRKRLMDVLHATGDPRVTGDGGTYDRPPFSSAP